MSILAKAASDSVKLDHAFQQGEVHQAIESLAAEAQQELDDVINRNAQGQDDTPVVGSEIS